MSETKLKCLLLGGGGFIGSHLAGSLLEAGYDVRIFDIRNFSTRNLEKIKDQVEIREGDFQNRQDVAAALVGIDHVFHLVSSTIPAVSMSNPVFDIESNLVSTVRLLEECRNGNRIRSFNFISSGGTVYGIPAILPIPESHPLVPLNSYGIIKSAIESYCSLYRRNYGLNCRVFRLSNPYGEHQNPFGQQGVIAVFLRKAIRGEEIEVWGDGSVVRDYIYIDDVNEVLTRSLQTETADHVFNIGSGEGHSLNDIIAIIRNVSGIEVKVTFREGRQFDVPLNVLDITRASKAFSWSPRTGIREGIQRVYKHFTHPPSPSLLVGKGCRG